MKPMVGGIPLWIDPIADYTIIEGQPAFKIPVIVRTNDDPHFQNDVTADMAGPSGFVDFVKGDSLESHYFQYSPFTNIHSDSWGQKKGDSPAQVPQGRPRNLLDGLETEKTFTHTVTARCKHPDGKEHEFSRSFTVRFLRDRDRDGVPDSPRPADSPKGDFQVYPIADYYVGDGYQMRKIPLKATEAARFYVQGLPPGMALDPAQPGQEKSETTISGKVWLEDWQPGEVSRKYRVRVHAVAQSDSKKTDNAAFMLTIYRASHDPFFMIFIEPIPPQTVMDGKEIKPVIVTVYSRNPNPRVHYSVNVLNVEEDFPFLVDAVQSIGGIKPRPGVAWFTEELTLKHLDVEKLYHEDLKVEYYRNRYELSGPVRLQLLSTTRSDDYLSFVRGAGGLIEAKSDTLETFTSFDLRWVRSGLVTDSVGLFSLMPMADQSVNMSEAIKPFKVGLEQSSFGGKSVPVVKIYPLPKGLSYKVDAGNPTVMEISGKPEVDWKTDESVRVLKVDVIAYRGKGKEMGNTMQSQSCNITVYRGIRSTPPIKAWGIWHVDDLVPISPIRIYADKGSYSGNLFDFQIEGLPDDVYMDGSQFIRGTPKITDWAENETSRDFPVTITAKTDPGLMPPQAAHFTMTVYRGEQQPEPLPEMGSFGMFGFHDQEYVNGTAITPIEIKYVNTYSEKASIVVEGLPPGVDHSEETRITGAPDIKDWLPTEQNRVFSVKVRLIRGESEISMDFIFNVLRTQPPPGAPGDMPPGDAEEKTPDEIPPGEKDDKVPDEIPPGDKDKKVPDEIPPEELIEIPPPREGLTIGIAVYEQDQAYDSQITGIYQGLKQWGYVPGVNLAVKMLNAKGDAEMALKNAQDFADDGLSLVIAMGQPMAGILQKTLAGNTPMLFLNVYDPVSSGLSQQSRLGIGPVSGASSLVKEDALVHAAVSLKPDAQWLALLHGPNIDGQAFVQAVEARNLGAQTMMLSDPALLLEEGKKLLQSSDLLILALDSDAKESIKQLREAALSENKVLLGILPSQVMEGAAAALAADPVSMGLSCGTMAAGILNGQDVAAIPYEDSSLVLCYFNFGAEEALGLQLPRNAEPVFE